jgi:hypothetical protein
MDFVGAFRKIERNRTKITVAKITHMEPNGLFQSFYGDFVAYIKVHR